LRAVATGLRQDFVCGLFVCMVSFRQLKERSLQA